MNYLPLNQRHYLQPIRANETGRIPLYAWMLLLCMAKLLLFRYFVFEQLSWSGIAADAAAIVILLSLVELVTPFRFKAVIYWPINLILTFMLFASTLYYTHFNTVPTYTALYALHQVTQIKDSVEATIRWSNYLFFSDIVLVVLGWLVCKFRGSRLRASKALNKKAMLVMIIGGLALCARMIQLGLPIQNELAEAEQVGFLNYQVSSVIKAARDNSVDVAGDINGVKDEIAALKASFPYSQKTGGAPAYFGEAKGKNVIVLQLEAFQNFPIHLKVDGIELTPNMNRLADEGFYFPHVFQQIGQGNTSDAEFMSNTSIYPTAKIAMSTGYGDRKLPSLPRLLQEQHYVTNTFHVNDVTFWDRVKLYPAIGFDHYFDKPFFNNDGFNSFGASDEELYRVGVEKLTEMAKQGKPFYAQFITASSHHPFYVPKDRRKIELPAEMEGTQLGDYLYAVNYTDYAIGKLIERLKENGLLDSTMLVMYGDHAGLQTQPGDAEKVSEQLGIAYHSDVSKFNIPLIIHWPGVKHGKTIDTVGGQLDIMPTMANLLGVSLAEQSFTALGQDLLNIDNNIVGMRYYLPTGSFFNNDILYIPGTGFEDGKAVSLRTLEPVTDLTPYRKDYDYILKLMEKSDQYVRSLPQR
ncbi:LTA synthase family protein [Paenibacillus sp. GCM10027626]|uniref:LTA synthase family protein n=1 Tax=Paenibacillus sp. GCM10027626 TaxID=3273411 RepID=UPI003633DEB7